ncbi:MAG: hypothetical protein HOV81_07165 [Kofleriaceae bacterium]|nr:hypothetical protein [Kofleriaceae bacterium]
MRRALLALCVALGALGAIPAADAKPTLGGEGYRSPSSRGYIYKDKFAHAKEPELGAGSVIAIILGVGIAAALAIVLARKYERYTSRPRQPD